MTDRSSVALRTLGSRLTLTGARNSLEGINTTTLDDGARCYVSETHAEWQLHQDSAAAPDGTTIIAPATGPGRWFLDASSTGLSGEYFTVETIADRDAFLTNPLRQEGWLVYVDALQCMYLLASDLASWIFWDASPQLISQAEWAVDPSGNDNNDGSLAHPLLTLPELGRRLFPFGRKALMTNDVTVYVDTITLTTQSYVEFAINVGTDEISPPFGVPYVFNLVPGIISTDPITLTGVVVPSGLTSTRGQLATAAGTFVAQERIDITSGPAIGAVCYSTGLNGNAQTTFVGALSIPTLAGLVANGGHGATLIPVAGDTCVGVTLLVTIRRLTIECTGNARVFVKDIKSLRIGIGGSSLNTLFAGIGGPVVIAGCQMISTQGRWECNSGGAFMLACRTPAMGKTSLLGAGWCLVEHAIQGTLGLSGEATSYGLTIDGGRLYIGISDDYNHPSLAMPTKWIVFTSLTNSAAGGGIECENGIGGTNIFNNAAIVVTNDSELLVSEFTSYLWGASGSFGYGINIMPTGYVLQGNLSPGVLAAIYKIPSLVNLVIANLEFAFSDNPIEISNSSCGLIGASYNVGNNYNDTDAGFYRTSQSANVGGTAFSQIKRPGMYQVFGYVATTTLDAAAIGTPVLNVIYTDDSGVQQTKVVATGSALTTLGGNGGSVVIECNGSALSSWSITGVTSAGAARFSVRMRVKKDCFGA